MSETPTLAYEELDQTRAELAAEKSALEAAEKRIAELEAKLHAAETASEQSLAAAGEKITTLKTTLDSERKKSEDEKAASAKQIEQLKRYNIDTTESWEISQKYA